VRLPEFNGAASPRSLMASCEVHSSLETTSVVMTTGRVLCVGDLASPTLASCWLAPFSGGGLSLSLDTKIFGGLICVMISICLEVNACACFWLLRLLPA